MFLLIQKPSIKLLYIIRQEDYTTASAVKNSIYSRQIRDEIFTECGSVHDENQRNLDTKICHELILLGKPCLSPVS